MREATLYAALACVALTLGACGGDGAADGGSAEDVNAAPPPAASPAPAPSPSPPAPAPPSPAPPQPSPPPAPTPPAPEPPAPQPPPEPEPPPPAPNVPPVPNAGADKVTVEEQDIAIDASSSRDPNGDALTYVWSLVSAPTGSRVAVTALTPRFMFRPDVPGAYELRVTVSDGSAERADSLRVTAEPLLKTSSPEAFSIDAASAEGSDVVTLKVSTSRQYRGNPVPFTLTSNAAWLAVPASGTSAAAGADASIPIRLAIDQLGALSNGKHEARVTVTPGGGWEATSAVVTLDLSLPVVSSVVPYVAYENQPSTVTLVGEGLADADGLSLIVNGVEAMDIRALEDTRARADVPPLPAGTYPVTISHALGIARPMSRIVVRPRPVYVDWDTLPDTVHTTDIVYDAERDAIYHAWSARSGEHFATRLQNDGGGGWLGTMLPHSPTFEPSALALSIDGSTVFATEEGCTVNHIDTGTLSIVDSARQDPCDSAWQVQGVAPLVDGRLLLAQRRLNEPTQVLEYPGFAPSHTLPSMLDSFVLVNRNADRMIVAPLYPEPTQPVTVHVYDVGESWQPATLAPGPQFSRSTLSMSANGARILHGTTLYDGNFNAIGRLNGQMVDGRVATTINPQGDRAVMLDYETNTLTVHDLTLAGGEYPPMTPGIVLAEDVESGAKLVVPAGGGAVFVFAADPEEFIAYSYEKFYVRVMPELAR